MESIAIPVRNHKDVNAALNYTGVVLCLFFAIYSKS